MTIEFQNHLSVLIDQPIQNIFPVSCGDISLAYSVKTESRTCFLKINRSKDGFAMFKTEKKGLEAIAQTQTISVPKVYACDVFDNVAFLLMEYIESMPPNAEDFSRFGKALAELHQHTIENFGLDFNNFIGSLPQSNKPNNSWVNFYTNERLMPQLQLAKQNHLLSEKECPSEKIISEKLEDLFFNVKPSLLHGDLWNGNYLISLDGTPYLIDPASYYGHSEVDMAMSKLFGGFNDSFYNSYQEIFPKTEDYNSRIELYQLYYLLVHLNLFGRSYYLSVHHILNKYF